MIAQSFEYQAPVSLAEALRTLAEDGVRPLAGGMSLIPMMKLRLAAPERLVDLQRVPELKSIRVADGRLRIGAMVTHYELESTPLVRTACPLLAVVASRVGDVQVRNRGTLGGSVAHADPAADYPAALLAMETEIALASASGSRSVSAADFFVDTFLTALEPGELITEISIAAEADGTGIAYEKQVQPASGFAIVGVAARVRRSVDGITMARVGVTGLGPKGFRAGSVEDAIQGTDGNADAIRAAASKVADGIDAMSDLHASAEYRSHLARVLTARALGAAIARATAS